MKQPALPEVTLKMTGSQFMMVMMVTTMASASAMAMAVVAIAATAMATTAYKILTLGIVQMWGSKCWILVTLRL